jgi:Fe-S oxidoreductase/nitrate reductase gamma subunit
VHLESTDCRGRLLLVIEPREHFWNVSLVWLFYALSFLAILLSLFGITRMVRRWSSGWRLSRDSADGPSARSSLNGWIADALAGAGIFKGDRSGGLAHFFALWGFVVLFIGTVLLTIDHHVVTFLTGNVWLVYSLTLDLFGGAFILSLLWLLLRRHVFRRHLLHRDEPGDSLLLLLLLVIAVTGFLAEAYRLAETTPTADDWSPIGALLAGLLPEGGLGAHRFVWWVHAICSLLLVAWIPFGKLRHALTSPLHRLWAARTPVIRTAEERGGAKVAFGAHELLAIDACTQCNRCENVCPSAAVLEELSPRAVISDLERASLSDLAAAQRISAGSGEVPWLCTSCGACRVSCPIEIDGLDLIRETRGFIVEEGSAVPDVLARALESIAKHGNPWDGKRSKRTSWAEGLDLADFAQGGKAPFLWLPGCTLAYDTRCQAVSRATARLLSAAGVDFMIAGKKELCSGDLARRCGEDGLFEMMIEENAALFAESAAGELVVSSPHDWHALAFEYPQLLPLLPDVEGSLPPARHVTEILAERVKAGVLAFGNGSQRRVAFHDPCYLGRHHGLFEAPREILRAIPGTTLVEMEENRRNSRCCGGGGGRMWFEPETPGEMKMSERRVRQAVSVGAEVLATACPYCLIQFEDAVKIAGLTEQLRVSDVTELAAEALKES